MHMKTKSIESFVNKENYTAFTCPYCQKTHRVSVAKHKGTKHTLIVKCTCQEKIEVNLNFRQFYRKPVKLAGEVLNVSSGKRNWCAMTVVDLSMSGLKFKIPGHQNIREGHRLQVRFTLDDQQANVIDKEARVVAVRDDTYGCEFLNLAYEEKELGYYLFPS